MGTFAFIGVCGLIARRLVCMRMQSVVVPFVRGVGMIFISRGVRVMPRGHADPGAQGRHRLDRDQERKSDGQNAQEFHRHYSIVVQEL